MAEMMAGGPAMGGGLMPRAAAAPPQQGGMPQGMPAEGGDPDQVSPEEQGQYDMLVSNAMKLIFSPKSFQQVVKSLEGGGDPVEGLAQTATNVFKRVLDSAGEGGFEPSGDAKWAAGKEVFQELADLSKQAGIHDFQEDQDGLEGAFFRAADNIRVALQSEGKLDQGVAQQDLAKLQQMDQSGELESKMMGLAERDAGGGQPQQEQQPAMPQGGGLMPRRMQ